jgi:lysyl-tRNA synthetase class 2
MIQQLSPEEIVRRESIDKLRALGIDPFPAAAFPTNSTAQEILSKVNL